MYRFTLQRPLHPEIQVQLMQQIPGAVATGKWLSAPYNCGFLVDAWLRAREEKFSVKEITTFQKLNPFPITMSERAKADLTPYQNEVLKYSSTTDGAMIWAPCGTGKSAATMISALQTPNPRIVWITRAMSKLGHRDTELFNWTTVKGFIIDGVQPLDGNPFLEGYTFVIINWEILKYHVDALIKWGANTAVFDEVQKAKNSSIWTATLDEDGNRTYHPKDTAAASAHKLAGRVARRLGCTATPLVNTASDLYGQFSLVQPKQWGARDAWMKRYADRHQNKWGGIDDKGASNQDELQQRISLSTIIIPEEVARREMPPFRRQFISVPESEQSNVDQKTEARETAGLGEHEQKLALSAARKKDAVFELVEEALASGQKVTVFVGRKPVASRWQGDFDKIAKKYNAVSVVISGDQAVKQRGETAKLFIDAPGAAVCFATIDSIGEAFDGLQCSHLAIAAFLPYTWGKLEQMEGRFRRYGAQLGFRIMYLICENSVDERIALLVLNKLSSVETLVGKDVSDFQDRIFGDRTNADAEKELIKMIFEGGL